MPITARLDYALRAVVGLAFGDRPINADRLSDCTGVPAKFLGDIMAGLRRAGLVNSVRGGGGGYWLARPASEITVADTIEAIDRPPAGSPSLPPGRQPSPFTDLWGELEATYLSAARQVTIADLASSSGVIVLEPGAGATAQRHQVEQASPAPPRPFAPAPG